MDMSFEQQWLEHDYNPFIIFSSNAKIISLNTEAQFLLGTATTHELFELATAYANISFGFKTTFLDLEFGRYKFFGITVGYENEQEIGIKFYQKPSFKLNSTKPTGTLTNIFTLVDLCISTNSINSNILFTKDFDPTIPEVIINANNFIKVLNQSYSCFDENDKINTKVYFRVGEHINFEKHKYSIFSVEISSLSIDKSKIIEVQRLVDASDFYADIQSNITINIPMILD